MRTVDVIMPAYNAIETLPKTLNSLLLQTHEQWRLWFINDGSTDGSIDIAHNWSRIIGPDQIRVFSGNNQGVSSARNCARSLILRERPEDSLIAFLDSDDIWHPRHLEESIKFLEGENLDFVYSDVECVWLNGSPATSYGIAYHEVLDKSRLTYENPIYTSTVVMSRKCFEVGEFDSRLDAIEDWDMWCRVANAGFNMCHMKKVLTTYTVNPNGVAGLKNAEKVNIFKLKRESEMVFYVKELGITSENSKLEEEVNKKISNGMPVKLHLGCGTVHLDGWINTDNYDLKKADVKMDATKIPLPDGSVDELYSSHLLEHFDYFEGIAILKEWYRVLKNGGKMFLETPDLLALCHKFIEANEDWRVRLYGAFFAYPWINGNGHKFLYTENQLRWTLGQTGFKGIVRVTPDSIYAVADRMAGEHEGKGPWLESIYMKVECQK